MHVNACASSYFVHVQGVENVYTQHTPLLVNTLEALIRGRLKDTDFPYIDKTQNGAAPAKVPKVCMCLIWVLNTDGASCIRPNVSLSSCDQAYFQQICADA